MKNGLAGRIAQSFMNSKLTVLLMVAFMAIGIYSSFLIPREEEPQIDVPMADIFVGYPGASPKEIETKVVKPLEKILSNIKGIEYVYSTSMKDGAMVIVQFYVGEDIERSFVKLYNEVMKNMDGLPHGVTPPLIKTRAIDDVPMLALTLWSETYSDYDLNLISEELNNEIEKITDVAITKRIGGRQDALRIVLDKDRMAENQIDILQLVQNIQQNNKQGSVGKFNANNTEYLVQTGSFLKSKTDVENLIIGSYKKQSCLFKSNCSGN